MSLNKRFLSGAVIGLLFPLLGGQASGQYTHFFWTGSGADELGVANCSAGDVNSDGFPEILAVAPGIGQAYVYSGLDGTVLRTLQIPNASLGVLHSVCGGADLNGDGVPDQVVGDSLANDNGQWSGAVTAFSGKNGAVLFRRKGAASGDNLGSSVSMMNGLLLVGARQWSTGGAGYLRLYNGSGTLLRTYNGATAGENLGTAVRLVPDLTGDGIPEVAAGGPGYLSGAITFGRVVVFKGNTPSQVLWQVHGLPAPDGFGSSLDVVGDVNQDGKVDLIAGAPGWFWGGTVNSPGSAYVLSGTNGSTIYQMNGVMQKANVGFCVSGAGDANGDGVPDYLVASRTSTYNTTDGGMVFLHSGKSGRRLYTFQGLSYNYLGTGMAAVGDLNKDGLDDCVIGGTASNDPGRLWALLGNDFYLDSPRRAPYVGANITIKVGEGAPGELVALFVGPILPTMLFGVAPLDGSGHFSLTGTVSFPSPGLVGLLAFKLGQDGKLIDSAFELISFE